MIKNSEKEYLRNAYNVLKPFSEKYEVDFDRYLFSLSLLRKIPNIENKKILDLGTGIGIMPIVLRSMGMNVSGLDYFIFASDGDNRFTIKNLSELESIWSENDVVVHKYRINDNKFIETEGKFDVLICEATIEHLKDPKKFLKWCHNLLNEGGYLLVTTPNIATFVKRIRFTFGRTPMWPIEDFFTYGEEFTGHWREYTMNELDYMMRASGFDVVEKYTKNVLAKFKKPSRIKKNLVALVTFLSLPFSNMKELHYILCKKK